METFRKDQALIESLLPELLTEEAPVFFGHNKWVPVYKSLRYMVLREFTTSVRSTRWLEALGLVRIIYSGLTPQHEKVRQWAKRLGLTADEAVDLISLFLDGWRRNRMVFIADDPVYSQYHRKDDPYIQLGLLSLHDFHPGGLDKHSTKTNRFATGLISDRGTTAVQALMKRIVPDPENTDVDALIEELWDLLKDDLGLIRKVGIQNTREHVIGEVWQVVHDRILVESFGQGNAARPASGSPPARARRPLAFATVAPVPPSRSPPTRRTTMCGCSASRSRWSVPRNTPPKCPATPAASSSRISSPSRAARTAWWPRRRWKWASTSGPWT